MSGEPFRPGSLLFYHTEHDKAWGIVGPHRGENYRVFWSDRGMASHTQRQLDQWFDNGSIRVEVF